VDESPPEGPRIAGPRGTQPQAKLGELVDTVMAVHFFSRVMATLPAESDLARRVDRALDKCLAKLEGSQLASGGWGGGTWAGVLQSALGCTALEFAQAAGKSVDVAFITSAREHQKANFDASSGRAHASDSAGVELYAASSSQRAAAGEARAAADLLDDAKRQGQLPPSAQVSEENLRQIGVAGARARLLAGSYAQNRAIIARLSDEAMLRGFGSNGGEEYLSYMLTSESMLMTGGEDWQQWSDLIRKRLETIQSADGSWTGHHCITSPVFCTAAVVQCLTTDRDAELLSKIREQPEEGSARP
ncbi:MAG: hypothetical protein ACE5GW_05480, partial [Planctomycetota bacterium]